MRKFTNLSFFSIFLAFTSACIAQNHAADLPTDKLLSEPGPTFKVAVEGPLSFIAFGDQRFTDPANVTATNPLVRKWFVDRIAEEKPSAVFLNGDVPLDGSNTNDYAVYKDETLPWRNAKLNVFPALGNHEFHGPDAQKCLENWWNAFPELRNRRWYSIQLGARIYAINLDSDASLLPASDQYNWLAKQISDLPSSVDFVLLSLHHPPSADIQKHIEVDHNPRPNEIALRDYLSSIQGQSHARFIVSAGHIHNYERHLVDNVTYLVSGGGAAKPYYVERTPDDLYKSDMFPNYHYVKFELLPDRLKATMFRIKNPEDAQFSLEAKDSFEILAKPHQ
jgi:hypothetical protein